MSELIKWAGRFICKYFGHSANIHMPLGFTYSAACMRCKLWPIDGYDHKNISLKWGYYK